MTKVVILLLALMACGGARTTIAGRDLYAHANELREQGRVMMPTSDHRTVELRADQYLVDRTREQVFLVRDVVAGCFGHALGEDAECTAALLQEQRFVISNRMPQAPDGPHAREGMSTINKARLVLLVAGVGMGVGAAKCNLFDGCKALLGIGAGLDALALLVTFTGFR